MRGGLLREILHHAEAQRVIELVHPRGVIGKLARLPSLQHHHGERRSRGDLLGQGEADESATGNHNIDGL